MIDDRNLTAFNFRDEFIATPIFVNDDQVDVSFTWRGLVNGHSDSPLAMLIDLLTERTSRHFGYRIVPETV
ncbi:hypothetical protein B0G75_12559 [Paraburkholderia sp. BL18I3N2]|uniref:hypothetical protein n=1 Tax=Paraburkholderia sp. BL18I3N2 TaxID=1938799 RepID=UPI000D05B14D|nr:hypothetical protein [Paraburkholderia sp. BL18I3N2]PRX23220.1 hypothetical protein B0G75_12559 [Paraburkholderia sp. BL18I3N2]